MAKARSSRQSFKASAFLPRSWYDALVDLRLHHPRAAQEEAEVRIRRPITAPHGRLLILAADHPARMVTGVRADKVRMGDRWELLSRVLRVVTTPGVDGLMATPDVLEEVLMLGHLARSRTGQGWLDGKVTIGCMNRGGLAGTVFELDDRMTAFTAEGLAALRCDGAKLMFRIDPTDAASVRTLERCAREIDACHARGLTVFLEAMLVERAAGGYRPRIDPESLIRVAGVAAGIGASSAGTWLKLPYGPGYDRVARATTLPILMLGGEIRADPGAVLEEFARGMAAGPNVRGALVGRNVSFAAGEDPRAVAAAAASVVHRGARGAEIRAMLESERGRDLDLVSRLGDAF
jgi:DhnA family fructose-bisphosphate aldolase class Ia